MNGNNFDEQRFNAAVLAICKQKKKPYNRKDWRCNDDPAKKCGMALEQIAEEVAALFREASILNYQGRIGRGMGFYPRRPGIMFLSEKEQPQNGVYPVLTFFDNGEGFYIACEESRICPQKGFYELAERPEYLSKGHGWDEHVAAATCFERPEKISRESLLNAFNKAISFHRDYRNANHKGDSYGQWCDEIVIERMEPWLAKMKELAFSDHSKWAFRGQGCDLWDLTNGLERKYYDNSREDNPDDREKNFIECERKCIDELRRNIALYSEWTNKDLDTVGLLSLMQHNGGATRLLDFSFSPYVALYMAIVQNEKEKNGNVTVWAVNLHRILKCDKWTWRDAICSSRETANNLLDGVDDGQNEDGLLVILPEVANKRLAAQEGLFLMQKRFSSGTMRNMEAIFSRSNNEVTGTVKLDGSSHSAMNKSEFGVHKFIFTGQAVAEAKENLALAQINDKTMFPDIEGLSRYCARLYEGC